MSEKQILLQIKQFLPSMPDQQQRVGRFVLDRSHETLGLSIGELSRACGVSNTTVLRFCRRLGLEGYREFRIELARGWDSPDSLIYVHVQPDDDLASLVNKVFSTNIQALQETQQTLDLEVLEKTVDAILGSRRVDIYSTGGAGVVARELHFKCMQQGVNANAFLDSQMQVMSAASLTENDLGIGISHTGRQMQVAEALKLARECGATTIALTSYRGTPVTEVADLVLYTAATATDTSYGSPIVRNAQMALVDVIYEAMILKGPVGREKMARIARAISAHTTGSGPKR
ncbi:MAG: MurR/RpiR family transcriptional regulator [Anaerolineales bacterium]|nr:MurR/RpiR family transcriptional regulator [Anaerolineales bacterium]